MIFAFINGFFLALGLILPLGVQNIFIFNQGSSQAKFRHALPSILTAGACDTLLIGIAILGISLIVLDTLWLKLLIFAFGFCFLVYMGYKTWLTKINKLEPPKALSSKQQVIFAASVSLLNPHAIFDSVAVLGTNSIRFTGSAKLSFAIACILVSWLWFFSIALAGRVMHKLDQTGILLTLTNKLSALIIWGVAVLLGWELVKYLLS